MGFGYLLGDCQAKAGTDGGAGIHILIPVVLIAAVGIWYLVQQVLGIYLRPWPFFLGNGA